MPRMIGLSGLCALLTLPVFANAPTSISDWADTGLRGWESKSFSGHTDYQIVRDGERTFVRARSNNSASGQYRQLTVDLDQTPILNWSWRVHQAPKAGDERSKAGDDYAARVYVIVSGGAFFWRTLALNYVWSANQAPGSQWPNAYTSKAQMLALRERQEADGQWRHEQRNVHEDLEQIFGKDIHRIDAIAIMTDTDNGGGQAVADYGDIWFSAEAGSP